MMPHKKSLPLREVQKIHNLIDLMKGKYDKDGKEISPNYTLKWDGSTIYWMGRLAQFCEPMVKKIQDTRDTLIKSFGTKNDEGNYAFKDGNDELFNEAIKKLLDTKESIRFPEFKASAFVKKKDNKIEEMLVPIDFWTVFSNYITMDIKEFEVEEEQEEQAEMELVSDN